VNGAGRERSRFEVAGCAGTLNRALTITSNHGVGSGDAARLMDGRFVTE
jgi:hypothetical protein